jgi:hypothetical protein
MAFNPKLAASGLMMYEIDHWKVTLTKVRRSKQKVGGLNIQSQSVASEGKRGGLCPKVRSRRFTRRDKADRPGGQPVTDDPNQETCETSFPSRVRVREGR